MQPITIIITEDHTLVREAWTMILNADHRFKVVAECDTAESCIDRSRQLKPDVILLDINLRGINGIEAISHLQKSSPKSKIVGVSFHTLPTYVRKMMKEGARGYVTKNSPKEEMITAILKVHKGERYICREIKDILSQEFCGDAVVSKLHSLSQRELEIISFIKKGFSSKEIAEEFFISVKTVEVHRYNILQKLDLKNAAELVNFCNKHNLDL